ATCGYQSETHMPHRPCCANLRRLARRLLPPTPIGVKTLPKLAGSGWPFRLVSSGFGSNRSRWLGPPSMNRKIQLLALAAKWDGLGVSGWSGSISGTSARAEEIRRSSASMAESARPPKPRPALARKSRRFVTLSKCGTMGAFSVGQRSIHEDELVEVQQHVAEVDQRRGL